MLEMFMTLQDETERQFLSDLFSTHQYRLWQYARKILNDPDLAYDAVNMVFMKLIHNSEKLRSLDIYKRDLYLITAVKNKCCSLLRAQEGHLSLHEMEELESPDFTPEDIILQSLERENIRNALQELAPYQRDILVMRTLLNMKDKEISALTEIKAENIRVYYARAIQKLKKVLLKQGDDL